ncbi:4-(cytidine 5'-diphospho)-2-C-methyl-D-erythritol kinase [bacterium]|nr:4-(cytidine 5'-diphospho)-2-C-methyl-D-erythritol kinase [bacterium]
MEIIVVKAYAKINLGLLLLDRRKDGYTDIATVFQEISLYDQLVIRKTTGELSLTSNNSEIPTGPENLVFKALEQFRNETGIKGGVAVHIEKSIPSGGGLGGGSSDAASALKAYDKLFDTHLPVDLMHGLALNIGSDVPFFINGGAAMGEGRGEILTPLSLPNNYFLVLVLPGIHVSTAWAYKAAKITLTKKEKITTFRALFRDFSPEMLKDRLHNEMETAVFERYPLLDRLKTTLYEAGAVYAGMSGSGSTLYGLYTDNDVANDAARNIETVNAVDVRVCQPVSRVDTK